MWARTAKITHVQLIPSTATHCHTCCAPTLQLKMRPLSLRKQSLDAMPRVAGDGRLGEVANGGSMALHSEKPGFD